MQHSNIGNLNIFAPGVDYRRHERIRLKVVVLLHNSDKIRTNTGNSGNAINQTRPLAGWIHIPIILPTKYLSGRTRTTLIRTRSLGITNRKINPRKIFLTITISINIRHTDRYARREHRHIRNRDIIAGRTHHKRPNPLKPQTIAIIRELHTIIASRLNTTNTIHQTRSIPRQSHHPTSVDIIRLTHRNSAPIIRTNQTSISNRKPSI